MEQISTSNLLLLYAYGEATPEQAEQVKHLLATNDEVLREFEQLKMTMGKLDAEHFSPSDTSVNAILEHTRHSEEVHH